MTSETEFWLKRRLKFISRDGELRDCPIEKGPRATAAGLIPSTGASSSIIGIASIAQVCPIPGAVRSAGCAAAAAFPPYDPAMINVAEPRERRMVGCGPLLHGDGRRKRVCPGRKVQS